jgi:hypothetical protein
MENLSIRNIRYLDLQLEQLGFSNAKQIVRSFKIEGDLSTANERIAKLKDPATDPQGIDYKFVLKKYRNNKDWHLYSIRARVFMDTARNRKSEVMPIAKWFTQKDGPLPPKDQIRSVLLELLKKEQVLEYQAVGRMDTWLQGSENTERQFKDFGFANYREMLQSALFEGDHILLQCNEKARLPGGNGSEMYVFRFSFKTDEHRANINLVNISAALKGPIEEGGAIKQIEYISTSYGSKMYPFQAKEQMIKDLLTSAQERPKLIERADKLIEMIKSNASLQNTNNFPRNQKKIRR